MFFVVDDVGPTLQGAKQEMTGRVSGKVASPGFSFVDGITRRCAKPVELLFGPSDLLFLTGILGPPAQSNKKVYTGLEIICVEVRIQHNIIIPIKGIISGDS